MMLLSLAWKSLRSRTLSTSLTIISIALSVALLSGVDRLRHAAQDGFNGTLSRTDLIVGARGGDLPLLLSTVFHIGSPSNEISWDAYQHFAHHPAVAWTIPISMGDSHRGFRVIATDANFYVHYQYRNEHHIAFSEGRAPSSLFEIAIGAHVASALHYRLGQKIVVSHGIESHSIIQHDNTPFTVVGILSSTATPVDQALYMTLLGDEAMHFGWEGGTPPAIGEAVPRLDPTKLRVDAITSFLLGTKSRISTLMLQREVASYKPEPLTGIIPAFTLQQLWSILDVVDRTLSVVSAATLIVGLLAMLIALYTTLNERRREIAILRAVGLHASQIVFLIMMEAGLIATAGVTFGLVAMYTGIFAFRGTIENQLGLPLATVGLSSRIAVYAVTTIVSALCLSIIPAWRAYRNSLLDGLNAS